MEQPIIFLAFSNSQDDYLTMLKRESKHINRALEALDDKGLVKIVREESADLDTLFHNFNRFKDQIAIFHYAGHASGENLSFEGNAGNADGLANLFAQQKNLKLVFLNGCSTKGQVDKLLALGIKAVIATSVPINDTKATEFGEQFYRALSNKSTIKSAFSFAVAWLQTKYGDTEIPTIVENHRGFVDDTDDAATKDIMPWGLYLNANSDVLDWTLPTRFVQTVTRPPLNQEFLINDYIYSILDDMIIADPNFESRMTDAEGNDLDDRNLLALIIGNYPWSIGSQLRRLVSRDDDMNGFTIIRLEQIINTYLIGSQVLFYILLAQMWSEKRKMGDNFPISTHFLDALSLHNDNFKEFDYFAQIRQILNQLKEHHIPFFVKELSGLQKDLSEKKEFYNSYMYLESLRSRLLSPDSSNLEAEAPQLCADAEYCLSIVIGKMSFLINYQMLTIRDILIQKTPHNEPTFNHIMGNLKAQDNDFLSLFKEPKSYNKFVDSRSVILVRDLKDVSEYLNLSPFIVDKNAFGDARATSTDLFMYAYNEDEEFNYFSIRHNLFKTQINDGDIIHTGLAEKSEAKVQRRSRMRNRGAAAQEANLPYEMLKTQFNQFLEDLS
ncbi:MAG: CHAT domain-containing protein [Saprospiraceae bacterium]|nr:CHAT domain-containing protein [Saprospiraceae bacterium]